MGHVREGPISEFGIHELVKWIHFMLGGALFGMTLAIYIIAHHHKSGDRPVCDEGETAPVLKIGRFINLAFALQFIVGLALVPIAGLSLGDFWVAASLILLIFAAIMWRRTLNHLRHNGIYSLLALASGIVPIAIIYYLMIFRPDF